MNFNEPVARQRQARHAHDGLDKIGEGTHSRAVVPWDRFKQAIAAKAAKAG